MTYDEQTQRILICHDAAAARRRIDADIAAGRRVVELDLSAHPDGASFAVAIQEAFDTPLGVGANVDSAIDWISDLDWLPGLVGVTLVLTGWDEAPFDVRDAAAATVCPALDRWRTGDDRPYEVLFVVGTGAGLDTFLAGENEGLREFGRFDGGRTRPVPVVVLD